MSSDPRSQPPIAACSHCGAGAAHGDGDALRCECGSLLARYVAGHIELKCRRCKRTITVPISMPEGGAG